MDGLALLCNLHADGPLTLRRLRRAGVRNLDDLARVPAASLATLLRTSATQAERFVQEGAHLGGRMGRRPLEDEQQVAAPLLGDTPSPAPVVPLMPARTRARAVQAYEFDGPVEAPVSVPEAPTSPLDEATEVSAAWPLEERHEVPAALAHELHEDHLRGLLARERAAARAPLLTGTPLRAGALPGLDARVTERLFEAGVRTYRQLVDEASLDLARYVRIPYPRLLDLQYHARDFLARRLLPRSVRGSGARQGTSTTLAPVERGVLVPVRPPDESARPSPPPLPSRPQPVADPGSAGPFV